MKDESNHPSDQLLLRSLDGETEPAESVELLAHTAVCARCRRRLCDMETVAEAVLAHGVSMGDCPAGRQRSQLLAALELAPRERSIQYRWLALAAAVLVAVGIWAVLSAKPPVPAAAARSMGTGGFIALPYSDENLAAEGAVVLQVDLPRSALLLAGMPVSGVPGGRVRAEVLVGADGLARGIRFIE